MKKNILLIIVFLFFQSCINERIDIKEASKIVPLTKQDLKIFAELRKQMFVDSIEIRKKMIRSHLLFIVQVGCVQMHFTSIK